MPTTDQQPVTATKPVLPATFANSFWSSDYRTGLQSLFTALDAATVQSQELAAHVERRIRLERTLADGLVPPALRQDGFALDEGASLRIGFEALLTSSVSEARARERLAEDLERTILVPFSSWSASHANRISTSRTTLFTALDSYESQHALVARLKLAYDSACRNADLAEDEYNFVAARDELGSAHVPPRPDDLPDHVPTARQKDEDDKPLGLGGRVDCEDSARAAKSIDDDAEGEQDEGLIGRSGATGVGGGSVLSVLGRALSVRKSGAGALRQGRRNLDDDEKEGDEAVTAATEAGVGGGTPREENEGLHLPAGLHLPTIDANEVKARLDWSKTKFSSLLSNVVGPQTGLEKYEKAKKDAEIAEGKYKREVVILDRLRLALEETISSHLPYLQRCESDRLRAATSVLRSFHAAIAALPKLIDASLERVGQALELCRPEKDMKAIIERRRTGPFQPSPATFQSHYSDEPVTTFGIDLRKYDETNCERETAPVPRVLALLLEWVERKGKDVSDEERRKAWLYDVPFAYQHSLRAMLNPPALLPANDGAGPDLSSIDLPVLCATTKLWFLELEQPPFMWAAYEELRSGWSTKAGITEAGGGGGETAGVDDAEEKVALLAKVVGKLPKIHFEVLRAVVVHLVGMIKNTETDEPLGIYLHKLSLSLARPLLRPKQTTPLCLDDRFPVAVISFLLTHPDEVFDRAAEIAKKEREDRYRPRRQRTKPVDERVRRSNLGQPVVAGSPPPVPPRAGPSLTVRTGDQGGRLSVPEKDVVLVSSPTEATREELSVPSAPAPDNQPRQASADELEEGDATPTAHTRSQSDLPEPVPVVPSPSSPVEAPFEQPPSPVEAPFMPPTSSSQAAIPSLGAGAASSATTAVDEKPLASSSSLKRSTGPASSGGRGLRAARGPRPPSQVLARVQALEQEQHASETSSSSSARTSSDHKRETE